MKLRHAAALAVVLAAGCGYNASVVGDATTRAEASAKRAEKAASLAESAAEEAVRAASRANSALTEPPWRYVQSANEASERTEMFYEATHPGTGVVTTYYLLPKRWVLMVPPHFVGVPDPMDQLPLRQWFAIGTFDTSRECKTRGRQAQSCPRERSSTERQRLDMVKMRNCDCVMKRNDSHGAFCEAVS